MLQKTIRVGVTEWHGAAHEAAQNPTTDVQYSSVAEQKKPIFWPIRSPIKGYLRLIDSREHEVIEAVISPIITRNAWIYSLAHYAEALAFSLFGAPIPRNIRAKYIEHLLRKANCKKIVFWSNAGYRTFIEYGQVESTALLKKATIVYPAIRKVCDSLVRTNKPNKRHVQILFNGDFFIKGGAHVVDAFERLQENNPYVALRLCCDEHRDFHTADPFLRRKYLEKIKSNNRVTLGRVPREDMLTRVFPETDIYVLPTYAYAFGFAALEAMAYGIPVIATNYFAIPEIVRDGESGLLIDTTAYECAKMFPGCFVKSIPTKFHEYMSESVYVRLNKLVESIELRRTLGATGLEIARNQFSFSTHNKIMREIYESATSGE